MAELSGVLVRTAVFLMVEVLVQGGAVQSPDTQVGCVFGGSCVLPCRFQPNGDTILHWVKRNGKNVQVHSYYDDQDQLGYQDPLYKGRTSLFHDQISGGNASLGLARVNLQDQGRYLCYTSTSQNNQEAFVTLTVRAPVTKVDIVLGNNNVTCQSGGIYPRPQLTWSVSPRPSTVLQNTTEVHEDDRGLYDISGSLRTVYNDTESTYSCSVQNEHSAKKAMMRPLPPMQSAPNSEVLLPCDASGLDDITWTFNHNQTILRRQAGQEKVVETEWQQHVRDLSESGSLLLYVTSSAQSEGTYRCTLRYADEEDVTHIELKILEDPVAEGSHLTLPMLQIIVFLTISALILWLCMVKQPRLPFFTTGYLFQFFFFGFIFIVFLLFCCCNAQLIASLI
ncbi:CD276 antigen isoform X2 [Gadus morhua]|uniref:CD276 antigen-like n=1 Tax=Gadus morhua TaxID=8049 RepID=A0A8C5CSJ5_GADMO|nr:CD276 antigen-like isoform X2 [Gadus morhua]